MPAGAGVVVGDGAADAAGDVEEAAPGELVSSADPSSEPHPARSSVAAVARPAQTVIRAPMEQA